MCDEYLSRFPTWKRGGARGMKDPPPPCVQRRPEIDFQAQASMGVRGVC